MTILNSRHNSFMTSPRKFLTVLVCFCLFYIAFSSDLMDPPMGKIKLRRDGKFDHHAIAHETYMSGFPGNGDDLGGLKTTTYPMGDIISTTSTIAADDRDDGDDNARKNQEKINKLMLDMLAAGVGEVPRAGDEDEADW